MSVFRKLASETVAYGLSSVLGRLLNYLLVPLYTSVFLPGEYGVVTELYAYAAFLNILYIYGLETAYFRFSKDEEGEKYFSLAFLSILLTSLFLTTFFYLNADLIAKYIGVPDRSYLVKWISFIIGIDAVVAIPFARLRKLGKATKFASFKLINILINIGLNLFFILLLPSIVENNPDSWLNYFYDSELRIGYVFLSNLIANACFLIFLFPSFLKLKLNFTFIEWQRMMAYAWPILIIGFAGVTNEMLSRAILKYRLPEGFYLDRSNIEALGIFGACYKLSVFMTLAIQAFRYAFEPFFFKQSKNANSKEVLAKVMKGFVIFTALSWVSVSLLLPLIAPIFLRQETYLEALNVVPLLLGGGMFLGIFYNLSVWYKLTDRTQYGAALSLFGAITTFVLNWTLIPYWGYMGSAVATFVSYFLMTIASYACSRKYYRIHYPTKSILFHIILAAMIITIDQVLISHVVISILILCLYLFLLFLAEFKQITSLIR